MEEGELAGRALGRSFPPNLCGKLGGKQTCGKYPRISLMVMSHKSLMIT